LFAHHLEAAVIGADSLTLDDISRACWKGFEERVISVVDAAAISEAVAARTRPAPPKPTKGAPRSSRDRRIGLPRSSAAARWPHLAICAGGRYPRWQTGKQPVFAAGTTAHCPRRNCSPGQNGQISYESLITENDQFVPVTLPITHCSATTHPAPLAASMMGPPVGWVCVTVPSSAEFFFQFFFACPTGGVSLLQ
jgi:hypothetical protein